MRLPLCIVLLVMSNATWAAQPSEKAPPEDAWRRLHQTLERRVRVDFHQTPLEEVVEYLRQELQVLVVIDVSALDEIGVGVEEPVTVDLGEVRFEAFLELVLPQLELTWTFRNGAILITTEEDVEEHLIARVYPVADLEQEEFDVNYEYGFDDLLDTIVATVESETWAENGGGEAEIRALPVAKALVISQSVRVHLQIERLLDEIRRVGRRQGIALSPPGAMVQPFVQRSKPKTYLSTSGRWRSPRVYRD